MTYPFRIECPECHWGYPLRDSAVNQGYLQAVCGHCERTFFFKITLTGVDVDVRAELPPDVPCARVPHEVASSDRGGDANKGAGSVPKADIKRTIGRV